MMREKNFTFWYCAFLFFTVSSSKFKQNFTSNEGKDDNLTIQYERNANSTTNYDYQIKTLQYDLYEKSVNNTRMKNRQYESHTTFTNNDREDDEAIQYEFGMHSTQNRVDDKQISMELRTNLTNANHKWNFTSHEIYGNLMNSENKNNSMLHEFYENSMYSILPELRNTHGFLLRNYSAALSIAYTINIVVILIKADDVHYSVCISIAFFNYLCFLASFFWLNVMSFDMWWTFRGFSSLQRNIKQQGKKKLVFYSIYAWGFPIIFAIISVIMDFFKYSPKILQPEFLAGNCWFAEKGTFMLYYYGFKSICIISSICLSISTTLKIARYEKKTGNRLTNSESKRFNDNKKWFNLYLKLFIVQFIVMGIKWSIMTASWLFENIMSNYVVYIVSLMSIIQNLCTFVIFVWKKKIKRLLLKRFGCGLFPEDRCARDTIALTISTCTTTSEMISMQKNRSSCEQGNCHAKNSSHGTEF